MWIRNVVTMLTVLQPGPLLTIQDRGRAGARRFGVPASGALDSLAASCANRLVGNHPGAATLEITAGGCALRCESLSVIAVAGADLGATLDAAPLPLWRACLVRPGSILRFTTRRSGARAYLAVAGGIAVAPQLGSRSALCGGPFGGMLGRPLRAGDRLPSGAGDLAVAGRGWPEDLRPAYSAAPLLRYLRGPHPFSAADRRRFHQTAWTISPASNRMGYRLGGAALSPPSKTLASLGVVPGVIQVPPDGGPIVLLADAQTTGGYPIIGTVIGADLHLAAQTLPGDTLRFQPVTLKAAEQAWRQLQQQIAAPLEDDDGWGAPI
jgi:biotin-dependent carboxylase-like uncharacterized protein